MSYILDALKKMEHDKATKAAPAGMTTISGDLFRGERPRSAGGGAWRLALAAVMAASLAVAATWYFLAPSGRRPDVASPPHVIGEKGTHVSAPAAPAALPPSVAVPAPSPPPGQAALAAAPPPVSGAAAGREGALRRAERTGAASTGDGDERAASPVQSVPPSDITVSGIAWQEERKGRRAVVNGFLLKEGSVVAGARVAEIRRDRVRFDRAGAQFDVSLAAPGDVAPGTTKPTTP